MSYGPGAHRRFSGTIRRVELAGDDTAAGWHLLLSADTVPWTTATLFSDVSVAVVGGVSCDTPWNGFASISTDPGGDTATLNAVNFGLPPNSSSVAITRWMLWDTFGDQALFAGDFSPAFTPPIVNPSLVQIRGITIRLGQCVPAVDSTVLHLSTFEGSGTVPLGSYSPPIGPAWSNVAGDLEVYGGALHCNSVGALLRVLCAGER